MAQTMQLNQYSKFELVVLAALAEEANYVELYEKLNADLHFLADMEKERES